MQILAVSDRKHKALYDYFDRHRWEDIDLVLSCGDIDARYLSFLVTMIPKPLLYVPGNPAGRPGRTGRQCADRGAGGVVLVQRKGPPVHGASDESAGKEAHTKGPSPGGPRHTRHPRASQRRTRSDRRLSPGLPVLLGHHTRTAPQSTDTRPQPRGIQE
jgi:hypothetical protein